MRLVGVGRVEWPAGHCCSLNRGPAILKPFGGAQEVERPAGEGSVGHAAPQAEAAAAEADPETEHVADQPRIARAGLAVGTGGLSFVGTAAVAAVVVLVVAADGAVPAVVVDVVPCQPVQEPLGSPV